MASSGVASGGVASMDAPAIIDSSVTPADNKLTAKAAKRARQKQRKVCAFALCFGGVCVRACVHVCVCVCQSRNFEHLF